MTSYATYAAGKTNIVHAKDRVLVLGFMVQGIANDVGFEVLYAVHPDGRVKEAGPIILDRPNNDFDKRGRVWRDAEAVPAHAEWIGHYEPTMF